MQIRSNLLNRALLVGLAIMAVAAVACSSAESIASPADEGSNEPGTSASLGIPAPGLDGEIDEMTVITDVKTDGGGFEVHPVFEGGKVIDGAGPVREGAIEPVNSVSLGVPAPDCGDLIDEMIVLDDTEAGGRDDIEVLPVTGDRKVVQGEAPVEVVVHDLPGIEVEPVEPVDPPSILPTEELINTVHVTNGGPCDAVQEPQVESEEAQG